MIHFHQTNVHPHKIAKSHFFHQVTSVAPPIKI
ncbi:hypothetical protein JOC69_003189 [Heliobacterium gestii]|nr:hypothetical protein [Heliomicrobium gestii]